MMLMRHQYIERSTRRVVDELLFGDRLVNRLYSGEMEQPHLLLRAVTSPWMTELLGFFHYGPSWGHGEGSRAREFLAASGIDLGECLEMPEWFTNLRRIFERKIRYWTCRPMPREEQAVVSPADSRVLVGSFSETSSLFLKGKFFQFEELLGEDRSKVLKAFEGGDFAIFRLTPDKYHYNHTPVAGRIVDIYEISGAYHSCNPGAVVAMATPYSKNKRVVTLIDTDVAGGTGVGMVVMIEVVALMIGEIVQCYSEEGYDAPCPVVPGMFVGKGLPKSLYRPGSSTDVLLFQRDRIRFCEDIQQNMAHPGIHSRFSMGFGRPLVETDLQVRSKIGTALS